jgi:flavin reductase (DIM6/NTAB) family NADH-FMN oxidoreductase RutF
MNDIKNMKFKEFLAKPAIQRSAPRNVALPAAFKQADIICSDATLTSPFLDCMMIVEAIMTVRPEQLRSVMRRWTSGVTIITARADGLIHGMTASSFASVSLDPPLVLAALANTTRTGEMIRRGGHFGVTILADTQQELSEIFAGRVPDSGDRFAGVKTETLESGVPFIAGGLAWLDCRLVQTIPAGSTTIYLGEVTAVSEKGDNEPLVYFNRDYQELCP